MGLIGKRMSAGRRLGSSFGCFGLAVALLASCSEEPPPIEEPEDLTRAPVAPDGCTLSPLELGCMDGAGEIPTSLGGANGLGGSGPVGEASCILRSSAQLSCPSLISRLALGRGSAGELDVAVGQKGLDGREESGTTYADERLHLATHRLAMGESSAASQSFEPIDGGGRVTLGVVPGNEEAESLLAVHRSTQHEDPELSFSDVFSGGETEFSVEAAAQGWPPFGAIGPVGDGAYVELVTSAASLVEGLPSDPRRFELGEATAVAVDFDEAGEPFVLLHQAGALRLLGGMAHDDLLFSEVREPSSEAKVDLLIGGGGVADRRTMLVEDAQTTYPQLRVQEGSDPAVSGSLSRGSRGCDGWTLNVDCSECPVGTACENTDFITRGARLFAFGERVLVAVHWIEQVDSRVTDT